MASFRDRIVGAAKLSVATYEEVEHDNGATGQAIAIVVLSSLAASLGSGAQLGAGSLLRGTLTSILSWFIWAALTYFIGTKILATPSTRATWGELLRTTGFAASPGMLRILGIIPFTSALVFLVTAIWMLIAFVIAVQAALDYEYVWRAVAVCFVGWVIYVTFGIFIM
ncbi:MAG TPA: YIP1 family protein [Terriglobia bacterium]|nr:YIP1 family protein [Terriglobia bacterium]